jgi:anti-anti-sigma factor
MNGMIVVSSPQQDIWAVAPQGRIDSAAARSVEDALNGLLDEGRSRIIVDFADVSYMASAGLRVLILSLRRARKLGGDVHLAAVTPEVREVLNMAGLHTLFTFQPSVGAAVRSLQSHGA